MSAARQLVLVGAGHTHVQVLSAFAKERPRGVDVSVVVDDPVAMYSGMATGYVAGQYDRGDLEIDARPLARACGAALAVSPCVRVDAAARRVELEDGRSIAYDVASFDIGSTVRGRGRPGVVEHAIPTRPLRGLIDRVDEVVERARALGGARPFRLVVVGGGVAGVELSLTFQVRLRDAADAPPAITLLDAGPRVLDGAPDALARRARRILERRGVRTRGNAAVAGVDATGVTLEDGARLAADAVVWVTGPASHSLFRDSGLSHDDGYLRVRSTLQSMDHDELFAAGDCVSLVDHPDTPKAGVYAVREGPILIQNLRAALRGIVDGDGAPALRSYRPQRGFLTLLNLGDGRALGTKWGLAFEGRWAMWMKDRIDRRFVEQFQV